MLFHYFVVKFIDVSSIFILFLHNVYCFSGKS
jgi:hypothetical protein